ncbi:MAG: hypothetical protein M3Q19_04425 [Pseudomonadota bacterium]|nr:hypothetical protein [Pseudomonadota bacterium]
MSGNSLNVRKTQTALDAHGHDPADYKWVPVLRRPRSDGWTPQRQRDFIAALADDGRVEHAARQVGMSVNSCYRLRRSPGGENFAKAWEVARAHAALRLIDIAFDRVIDGSDEPIFDKEGNRVGRRMRQNDRLHIFLMRAYAPDRFRHAHQDVRYANEPAPPSLPSLEEAMRQLEPVPPEQPHLLMAPEERGAALNMADMLDGELPHWHRGRHDQALSQPFDEKFERELERAKHAAAGLPADPGPPGREQG